VCVLSDVHCVQPLLVTTVSCLVDGVVQARIKVTGLPSRAALLLLFRSTGRECPCEPVSGVLQISQILLFVRPFTTWLSVTLVICSARCRSDDGVYGRIKYVCTALKQQSNHTEDYLSPTFVVQTVLIIALRPSRIGQVSSISGRAHGGRLMGRALPPPRLLGPAVGHAGRVRFIRTHCLRKQLIALYAPRRTRSTADRDSSAPRRPPYGHQPSTSSRVLITPVIRRLRWRDTVGVACLNGVVSMIVKVRASEIRSAANDDMRG
jgi:hypothetical protein